MPQELFRREALEARGAGWLGRISLVQPVSTWLLTSGAVAVSLAVILFLCCGTYTVRSRVVGHLVPTKGLVTVVAPASGVVSRSDIAEGDALGDGDLLAVVAVPRATPADGDTATALRARLRERRESLESTHAAERRVLAAKA